jgi:hypothetical protein
MNRALEFAAVLDDFAQKVLMSNDPRRELNRAFFALFATDHDYRPASTMERARFDISELGDAPWGPQSRQLTIDTARDFAREWLALPARQTEEVQQAFFSAWVDRAQALLDASPPDSQNERRWK